MATIKMADAFHQLYLNFALMGIQRLWVHFQKKKRGGIKMIALLWIGSVHQISTYSHHLSLSLSPKKNEEERMLLCFCCCCLVLGSPCVCHSHCLVALPGPLPRAMTLGEILFRGAASSTETWRCCKQMGFKCAVSEGRVINKIASERFTAYCR